MLAQVVQITSGELYVLGGLVALPTTFLALVQLGDRFWGSKSRATQSQQCQFDHSMIKDEMHILLESNGKLAEAMAVVITETKFHERITEQRYNQVLDGLREVSEAINSFSRRR